MDTSLVLERTLDYLATGNDFDEKERVVAAAIKVRKKYLNSC